MHRGAEVLDERGAGRRSAGHAAERGGGCAGQDEERGLPVSTVRGLQVSMSSQQLQLCLCGLGQCINNICLHCRDGLESVSSLYNQVEEKLHMLVMRSNESLQHLDFLFRLREMEAKISTVRFLN